MTDGEKSKSKVHSRGSNKVGDVSSTAEKSIHSDKAIEGPSPIHLLAINGDKIKLQEELRNNKWDINEIDQLGRTPLVYSVLGDQIECVSMLLKIGADINIADIDERTALHWAAYQGNHKLVKLLLSKGAKVKQDKEGRTPLHLSTSHDNIKVMEALLRSMKKQDINLHDNNKVTPLCWSVFYDRITYTRLLLKHGADPSIMDKESRTVLHWTSQNKDDSILKLLVEVVETLINWPDCQRRTVLHMTIGRSNKKLIEFLLSVPSIDINFKDNMGRTPLHWAAVLGDTEIVSYLLEKGADHTISDDNGVYPLHYAAQTDSHETVVAMLDKEGIKDLPDNEHGTALMWAAVKGSDKVLEILLEKRCSDVNAVDAHMQTALHKCTQSGHLNCVKILIQYGAEVNVYDKKHHIPLFYACASGHGDIVKELLNNGSSKNLDEKDAEGRCPIHYAAMVDRTDIIKILLEHNSNANTQDNDGCTPLHFASFLGFVHCISVLLENGASVNLQDNVGRTALHLACRSGNVDAVKLLVSRFNACVNVFAHEDEELTPLDYAILEDHQDVAFYLKTEHNADTAIALKELSATKIQAVWKGYYFRKIFSPVKHLFVKHEIERKNTIDGALLSSDTEFNNMNIPRPLSLACSESGQLRSDNDSHSNHSRSETKSRSNISSVSCKTVSSNSSVFFPPEKSRSVDNLHKPKQSVNENSSVFDALSINALPKQIKGARKVSSTRNFQENSSSKRVHKNSMNSLHSYSRYHQSHSPISSSSSSDLFTNNTLNRRNEEERNNLFNKSYSRYISESKPAIIKSSSSESSVLFDSRPMKHTAPSFNSISKHNTEQVVTRAIDVRPRIVRKIDQGTLPKVKIIQPDTTLEKPWNIYRNDQKRIYIIRQQSNAALKIQKAFRSYLRNKYSAGNEIITCEDEKDRKEEISQSPGINDKSTVSKEKLSEKENATNTDLSSDIQTDENVDVAIETNVGIPIEENVSMSIKENVDVSIREDIENPIEENVYELIHKNSNPSLEDNKGIDLNESTDNQDEEDCYDECIEEVAALLIQLAWRKYVKRKLLEKHSGISKDSNSKNKYTEEEVDVNLNTDICEKDNPPCDLKQTQNHSPGKQVIKMKKDASQPPIAHLQKLYLSDNARKIDDHSINNTLAPLRAPIDDPPSCRSPLRSNSSKLRSPNKTNVKYPVNQKQSPAKKITSKSMKVK